jgi:hypothetical protein
MRSQRPSLRISPHSSNGSKRSNPWSTPSRDGGIPRRVAYLLSFDVPCAVGLAAAGSDAPRPIHKESPGRSGASSGQQRRSPRGSDSRGAPTVSQSTEHASAPMVYAQSKRIYAQSKRLRFAAIVFTDRRYVTSKPPRRWTSKSPTSAGADRRGDCSSFAAMHESGTGTSRHFAVTQQFSRFRSEADIQRAALAKPDL